MQPLRPLLRQAVRASSNNVTGGSIKHTPRASIRLPEKRTWSSPVSVCLPCQLRYQQRRCYSSGDDKQPQNSTKEQVDARPGAFGESIAIDRSGEVHDEARVLGDNAEEQRQHLPSQKESQRSHISRRFSHLMDNLQGNIFIAGQRLNDLTGYSGIEALKKDIEEQGPL